MDSGVATRPIVDWDAYIQGLNEFVYHSGMIHEACIFSGKMAPKRLFSQKEDERGITCRSGYS